MDDIAPDRIAIRWTPGSAVTSGPLMDHPDYTRYVREDFQKDAKEMTDTSTEAVDRRMCINCGRYVGADHDRALPGPDCPSPDVCTFELTQDEAWQYWRRRAYALLTERDDALTSLDENWLTHQSAIAMRERAERAEARVALLEAALRETVQIAVDLHHLHPTTTSGKIRDRICALNGGTDG
jgi:hypothetical protein